jgi:hypothetical protein
MDRLPTRGLRQELKRRFLESFRIIPPRAVLQISGMLVIDEIHMLEERFAAAEARLLCLPEDRRN